MPGQSPSACALPDGGAVVVEGVSVDGVVVVPVEGMSVVAVAVDGVVVVALLPVLAAYALVPPTRAPAIESIATVFLRCACMSCSFVVCSPRSEEGPRRTSVS
jgi:hypothetical protein